MGMMVPGVTELLILLVAFVVAAAILAAIGVAIWIALRSQRRNREQTGFPIAPPGNQSGSGNPPGRP